MLPSVSGPLPRSALLPTSTVVLEGREVVAPADPERLLALTYGPHWRVPDPSFGFTPGRSVVRHMTGFWQGEEAGRRFWEQHHKAAVDDDHGSSFARWVHARIDPGSPVVELGCGGGADAAWLGGRGHPVEATDFAASALVRAQRRADALPRDAAPHDRTPAQPARPARAAPLRGRAGPRPAAPSPVRPGAPGRADARPRARICGASPGWPSAAAASPSSRCPWTVPRRRRRGGRRPPRSTRIGSPSRSRARAGGSCELESTGRPGSTYRQDGGAMGRRTSRASARPGARRA